MKLVRGTLELQESKLEDLITLIQNLKNFIFFVSAKLLTVTATGKIIPNKIWICVDL